MLNLFDYLTEKDNKVIENYIHYFGIEEGYIGNEIYLQPWAESNKKLFSLLGGKLIHTVPYSFEKPKDLIIKDIRRVIHQYDGNVLFFSSSYNDYVRNDENNLAINMLENIFYDVNMYYDNQLPKDIELNLYNDKKPLKLNKGMKPIRALTKIINYIRTRCLEDRLKKLENFRIDLSMVFNERVLNGELCFSIHPMDYFTMSDNASDWGSCMSWMDEGCYHAGTVEMMNSNNVVCVYLKSKKPFVFGTNIDGKTLSEDEAAPTDMWNNKKWRQLFYITKDIIVGGKSYPYNNNKLTIDALNILRELAKQNWKNEYEFGPEEYRDMKHICGDRDIERVRSFIRNKDAKKHNIIFTTNAMYNDMLNDHETVYYCVRNKVKHNLLISYSGKCNCLKCNNTVYEYNDDAQYWDEASDIYNHRFTNVGHLLCYSCQDNSCDYCDDYNGGKYKVFSFKSTDGRIERICSHCLKDRRLPKCDCCGAIGVKTRHNIFYKKTENVFDSIDSDREKTIVSIEHNSGETVVLCDDCYNNLLSSYEEDYDKYSLRWHRWSDELTDAFVSKKLYSKEELEEIRKNRFVSYSEFIEKYQNF